FQEFQKARRSTINCKSFPTVFTESLFRRKRRFFPFVLLVLKKRFLLFFTQKRLPDFSGFRPSHSRRVFFLFLLPLLFTLEKKLRFQRTFHRNPLIKKLMKMSSISKTPSKK